MSATPVQHQGPCFVCEQGDESSQRIHNRFFWEEADQRVVSRAWLGPLCQGPPGHAHGGSLFALLDEAMGMAAWKTGHKVLAAHVEIDFRRPVRLGTWVEVAGRVERVHGRKVHARGEIRQDGELMAESTGLFVAAPHHAWDIEATAGREPGAG